MKIIAITLLIIAGLWLFDRWSPIRRYSTMPGYSGKPVTRVSTTRHDTSKVNVFIVAYNPGTEIFDLVAPFYLFNLTGKANVYIVAPEKSPITLINGLFVMPHYTIGEIDSLMWSADVLVIPNLSAMGKKRQSGIIVDWIKKKYSTSTKVLSVCAGSFTAASTGLFDGLPITSHAYDLAANKLHFSKPVWVDNVAFTSSGNFYSTAGVANAVEGTLAVIRDLFGTDEMNRIMKSIHYPGAELSNVHQSIAFSKADKNAIIKKTLLRERKRIAVLLQNQTDEFYLSAILDSYHRSFPRSIKTFSEKDMPVTTRFGLVILPTGKVNEMRGKHEVHLINGSSGWKLPGENTIVTYQPGSPEYIFDVCLERIKTEYGRGTYTAVKRLLDYN